MNFSTPSRVLQTIRAGDTVEWSRGENRTKINNQANCAPPLSPETAKKLGIKINVNWGELMTLLAHARRQYMNAFWSNLHFFKVSIPLAPSEKQADWGNQITQLINKPMRNSLSYFELHRSKWAAVVCHGPGPMMWYDQTHWKPEFVAIEDLRIPTDTTLDFDNLDWWAVRHIYTPYELLNKAFSDSKRNKWNKKGVARILKNYKEINFEDPTSKYDWETQPEKLAEVVKQDGGYYASDAMPGIPLWHFYFKDETDDNNKGVFMRIVPETQVLIGGAPEEDKFLWTSEEPEAESRDQLLHCQFGDLCNKAPFNYHSIRSLGFALLEPTFYTNITRCRLLQHLHDNFNVWLRVSDPADRARPQVQEFANYGVVKPGVDIITQQQRHQIDPNLVEMGMAQLKQLQQEASSSYTQDIDTGTKREQTAFETGVKMQQINAMMGGLLMNAFIYEGHAYREICRRFCLKNTDDPDILMFQKRCDQYGIPRRWLNHSLWDIEPVTPLGMGNPTMAMASAQQLMSASGAFDATAQQEIKHEWVIAVTNDARKAARWAPLDRGKIITDSTRDAQAIFGTLMQGVPVPPREELSATEQIEAMLPMMAGVIVRLTKAGNVADEHDTTGLQTVAQYIAQQIQSLAGDPQMKQRVKQYGDALGKLMNQVKGLTQRGAEQKAKQNGKGDPSAAAKVQSIMMTTAAKVKAKQMSDQQKQRQNSEKFIREERRKDAEAFADIERENLKAKVQARNKLKSTSE